jgi:ferredoxin-NADP reductase
MSPTGAGHLAGQHVDVRLTAEDGYSTQRSYSIATPAERDRLALSVQRIPGGEVSPYLVDDVVVGDAFELRGPIGGWFAWHPGNDQPVLLVAGGSGVVPLMAMIGERAGTNSDVPFRLIYSATSRAAVLHAGELARHAATDDAFEVSFVFTRLSEDAARPAGRLTVADLEPPKEFFMNTANILICGPTGFVETVAQMLLGMGTDPAAIKTERFGPSGG